MFTLNTLRLFLLLVFFLILIHLSKLQDTSISEYSPLDGSIIL